MTNKALYHFSYNILLNDLRAHQSMEPVYGLHDPYVIRHIYHNVMLANVHVALQKQRLLLLLEMHLP